MTKNRRIFPSAAPEPASPLTEAPRRKRKNWRSWLTIQVESERYQPPRSGILLLQVLVGIFFFVFVTRFWYLQLHLGPEMTTQAQKNRLRTERIFAPRGRIFDDHGNILADNRTAYGLAIIREDCPDIPATLAQISQWTDTPLEQLQNRYNQDRFKTKPFEALPLVSGLDFGQVARIEAELVNWPGLEIMVRTNRYYPEKDLFAHVLGYVAEANSAEMEKDPDLAMGDLVGKAGLELELEKRLRGHKGLYQMEVDAHGRMLAKSLSEAPSAGQELALSLDRDLQQAAWDALAGEAGCVVVMEPDTGKLRALVTSPAYDNNLFAAGISRRDWEALRTSKRYPLQNRVIQSVYPPGSVWKLLMAVFFLENGVDPRETVFCGGQTKLGNQIFLAYTVANSTLITPPPIMIRLFGASFIAKSASLVRTLSLSIPGIGSINGLEPLARIIFSPSSTTSSCSFLIRTFFSSRSVPFPSYTSTPFAFRSCSTPCTSLSVVSSL